MLKHKNYCWFWAYFFLFILAEIKKQELIEDFKALKKSGKLEKYLEKKRKKNFAKDTKRFYN